MTHKLRTSNIINQAQQRCLAGISALIFAYFSIGNSSFASTQPENNWTALQSRGVNALDANQYWIAEPNLKQAMMVAEMANPKDIRLAKSLAELGRLYTIRGHFNEAESYVEEELSIRELISGNDKFQCIPTMSSLIQFYLNYGTVSKATPLSEEMLSLVEGKLNEARSGSTKMVLKKGQPLQGWLGVAAPVMKDPIIEWAIACDAAANCHRLHGNYDMAKRLFNAALDIKTTVYGNNHLSLANSYDSLGTLCLEKNDLNQAESFFTDALSMTEKTLGSDSPEVFNRLDKLAKCLIKEEKYTEAEKLYIHAQDFFKNDPLKSDAQARAAYALGSLYCQQHKYDEAAPYLEKALHSAQEAYGPSSITVVPYLQRYAYNLYYLGRKDDMEQFSAKAIAISGNSPSTP